MSTYNGERFLREQINSLISQKLPDDTELNILVRDDGSKDSTTQILDEYKARGLLEWYTGENLKPAKSFWNLVQTAPHADFYCFCDQDDIWYDDKIARAIGMLREAKENEQPLLYCSNVNVADEKCRPLYLMNKNSDINTSFTYSLIYSLAPGCTMVFNDNARREFVRYDMNKEFELIHDWLAHKIVAMLGKVVYDPTPSMLYRQHGKNAIGAQRSGIRGFIKKVKRILGSYACARSESAKSLLNVYKNDVSEENRRLLNIVANYKEDNKLKKEFLKEKIVTSYGKRYLKWVILINKV